MRLQPTSIVANTWSLFCFLVDSSCLGRNLRPQSCYQVLDILDGRKTFLQPREVNHTVRRMPADMQLTRIEGAAIRASDLARWIWAALVTASALHDVSYGKSRVSDKHTRELPLSLTPAILVEINAPSLFFK